MEGLDNLREVIGYSLLVMYALALSYVTLYCLFQFFLLFFYKKNKNKYKQEHLQLATLNNLPTVTIQLPIFNEKYVVSRLIDNIIALDYPRELLEIHILDDSTDDTLQISQQKVEEYKAKGFNIELFHRKDRSGYKAGALKAAMPYANGEFIAIFDADFLPKPDFLRRTIIHFDNEKVGVVQTRWEHINQEYSLLTRLQAIQLNVHFTIEQQGRRAGSCLLQFNGTAGVWRRTTIDDAGGWEADTLTEDLDLSYRAQLKGWEIVYLEYVTSPAELPAEMSGLKSQQYRWMKGGAESARKLLPTVLRSKISLRKKIFAVLHLMSSSVFVMLLLAGLCSVPLLFLLPNIIFPKEAFQVFLIGTFVLVPIYFIGNVRSDLYAQSTLKLLYKFLILFPIFIALSMGLSLHNSVAVVQGWLGKKTPFVRTPKFAIQNFTGTLRKREYLNKKIKWTTVVEGILSLYFLGGVIAAYRLEESSFLPFHFLLAVGFGGIFFYSVKHLKLR